MLKIISVIFHWFVLFVVGMALVGVNIVQLYCMCCDESHLQVEVVPQEKVCACEKEHLGEVNACCLFSGKELARHDFYKIAGFSSDVKKVVPETSFLYIASFSLPDFHLWLPEKLDCFIDIPDLVPDEPPSQESLCTYRC